MPMVIPANLGVLISIEYPADGLGWARVYDNPLIGWTVDETGAEEPLPVIIGQLPTAAPDTGSILSPQWATYHESGAVLVPDLWRGNVADFLTWLATNNGATRPLGKRLGVSVGLFNGFDAWASANPALVMRP